METLKSGELQLDNKLVANCELAENDVVGTFVERRLAINEIRNSLLFGDEEFKGV